MRSIILQKLVKKMYCAIVARTRSHQFYYTNYKYQIHIKTYTTVQLSRTKQIKEIYNRNIF